MHPKSSRRVHSADFKSQVMAECQQPGASVAAVSLAHGLNVNLVRKWLVGRGLRRAGLIAPRTVARSVVRAPEPCAAPLQFVPVGLAPASRGNEAGSASIDAPVTAAPESPQIHIELRRGGTQLSVRWPMAAADACAAWLRELPLATLD